MMASWTETGPMMTLWWSLRLWGEDCLCGWRRSADQRVTYDDAAVVSALSSWTEGSVGDENLFAPSSGRSGPWN